jgi:ABC-2 type transport system permease protein
MFNLLAELVRKDFLVFVSDRKAMIFAFAVPIAIACFLGSIMGNISGGGDGPSDIPVLIVNQDSSPATAAIVDAFSKSKIIKIQKVDLKTAQEKIRNGDASTAIVFDQGFGPKAVMAMHGGDKPDLTLLTDPARSIETQAAKGVIFQTMMPVLAKQAFGDVAQSATELPFNMKEKSGPTPKPIPWSGKAHAFAGLGVQGLFFGAMETAMTLIKDRRLGIWSRLRASPVNRYLLLLAKFLGSNLLAFFIFLGVFGFGALIMGYRILGSWPGFFLVAFSIASMTASVGLFIATLGRTENQSRGLSILVILSMLMLGGAWIPIGFLPGWVQTISLFTPVRWAVDGVDFMTWKAGNFGDALQCALVLWGFAAAIMLFVSQRFRWSAEER